MLAAETGSAIRPNGGTTTSTVSVSDFATYGEQMESKIAPSVRTPRNLTRR